MTEKEMEAVRKNALFSDQFSHEHKDAVNIKKTNQMLSELRKLIRKSNVTVFIVRND